LLLVAAAAIPTTNAVAAATATNVAAAAVRHCGCHDDCCCYRCSFSLVLPLSLLLLPQLLPTLGNRCTGNCCGSHYQHLVIAAQVTAAEAITNTGNRCLFAFTVVAVVVTAITNSW
jgi:hypothetical protein